MKAIPRDKFADRDIYRHVRIALWLLLVMLAVGALPTWRILQAKFGPMLVTFSQCEICGQSRVVETMCGRLLRDEITPNDHSRWLGTFVPADHQHLWVAGSSTRREEWFGSTVIACGSAGVLATIHAQRSNLSEEECQQLVEKYHGLLRAPASDDRDQVLNEFARAVREDPHSLLGK